MAAVEVTQDTRSLRCSAFAREERVDAVGSAGSYDVFVLVEHPLPWPREITDDPLMGEIAAAAARAAGHHRRVRLQALVPQVDGDPLRTAIVYVRPDGPFVEYERREARAGALELAGLVEALVTSTAEHRGPDVTSDVLVCTHGTRDVCCGSLGTALWRRAPELAVGGHRLWRTSHTGGHRFAPTALTFPAGQAWAYLDERVLHGIVTRSLTPEALTAHYRGAMAFGSPAAQAAERSAFARHGWDWVRAARTAEETAPGHVRITYAAPDGSAGAYDAKVAVTRELPVPVCGRPVEEATKTEAELSVTDFRPA
jgi:hypothetical protein